MKVGSPAKINWLLRVLGRRADGYHEIETIFQEISLHDTIELVGAERFSISCDDPAIPTDESNLVARAWRALREAYDCPPVSIELTKRIPAKGGLGGGSSNAAATLRALVTLFSLPASDDDLRAIGAQLGSDVPFFLAGGTAYATGRGEQLRAIDQTPGGYLLLVVPAFGVSTAEAYQELGSSMEREQEPIGYPRAVALIGAGPLEAAAELVNDFEPVVTTRFPEAASIMRRLEQSGANWVRLSGSGSTIVGWYHDRPVRDSAAKALGQLYPVLTAEPVGRVENEE